MTLSCDAVGVLAGYIGVHQHKRDNPVRGKGEGGDDGGDKTVIALDSIGRFSAMVRGWKYQPIGLATRVVSNGRQARVRPLDVYPRLPKPQFCNLS